MKKTLSKLHPFAGSPIQRSSVDNFYIDLEEPHKHYAPGDSVRGHVVVLLLKPTRLSSLGCVLRGQISIKNPVVKGKTSKYTLFQRDSVLLGADPEEDSHSLASEDRSTSTGRGSRLSLFRVRSNRSDHEEEAVALPRGEHAFEFEFELPNKDVYTSLEFERGSISYAIVATCHRSGSGGTITTTRMLTVVTPIDVSKLSAPKPTCLSIEVRKKKKQQGSIVAVLEVPHRGYLRGESIPVKLSIKHIKAVRSVGGVIVTLSRISRVIIEGSEPQTFRKDITQTVSPLLTDPESFTAIVKTAIRIPPDTFPTTKGHPVVSFQYCLEAVVDLAGSWGNKQQADNSGLGMIDTDKLVSRRGVVNLWADIVIGTDRSIPSSQFIPSPVTSPVRERSGTALTMSSTETSTSYQRFPQDSPSYANHSHRHSHSHSHSHSHRHSHSHSHSHSVSYDVPAYEQTSQSNGGMGEKQRLQLMEQALLPSQPPDEREEEEGPSAPIADEPEDDLFVTPQARRTHMADKREMERQRLQQLASEPEPEDVPLYEESPSAPPALPSDNHASNGPSCPSIHEEASPLSPSNGPSTSNGPSISNGSSASNGPSISNGSSASNGSNDDNEPSAPPIPPGTSYPPNGTNDENEPSAPPIPTGPSSPSILKQGSIPTNGPSAPPAIPVNPSNTHVEEPSNPDDEEPSAPPIDHLRLHS